MKRTERFCIFLVILCGSHTLVINIRALCFSFVRHPCSTLVPLVYSANEEARVNESRSTAQQTFLFYNTIPFLFSRTHFVNHLAQKQDFMLLFHLNLSFPCITHCDCLAVLMALSVGASLKEAAIEIDREYHGSPMSLHKLIRSLPAVLVVILLFMRTTCSGVK